MLTQASMYKSVVQGLPLTQTYERNPMKFNFEDSDQIRQLLKSRAYCVKMGLRANQTIFATFDKARADYIEQVGVTTYVEQMLGEMADVPAGQCAFYQTHQPHHPLVSVGNHQSPVRQVIHNYLRGPMSYLKIQVHHRDNDQVNVCYL